ncbi:HD domain-containing protein [Streptomyces sp. NPDC058739]|uniref:HD domain-containing protein n=1 Tax=Streptomyces sp. NPDC058739 TaxID=3346618 RepID=UPI0036A6745C
MELRGVDELMDLLSACRGVRAPGHPVDLHEHSLQTAALLRRGRPADKELQVAGLVHDLGRVLRPGDVTGHAEPAADAVRPLLGERVSRLVRLRTPAGRYPGVLEAAPGRAAMSEAEAAAFARDPLAEEALALRQADDAARVPGLDAGVLEDWRTLLELLAARRSRLGAVD